MGVSSLARPAATAPALPTPTPVAAPHLLGVLGSVEAVCDIGRCYRALVPDEDDAGVLTRALAPSPTDATADDVERWMAGRVRQDFAEGHTVTVQGWILSVTEARQCALYSLTRG